ncbi:MAG: hypothetical protein ACXWUL_04520, partial [Caldimonas sp.]
TAERLLPRSGSLTRERVFARTWQWLGDLADVEVPGTLSPREMLPGHLDEPLLLARDRGARSTGIALTEGWHGPCTCRPMWPPFVDSDSRLHDDAPREGVMRSQSGRLLVVAIVIAVAASAAALLVN